MEAHKPVIHGRLIQQAATLKRECKNLYQKLEAKFNTCHAALQSTPNPTTNSNLEKARLDFDLFLTDSADKLIRKRQHLCYLKANKPDTPMACTLRVI